MNDFQKHDVDELLKGITDDPKVRESIEKHARFEKICEIGRDKARWLIFYIDDSVQITWDDDDTYVRPTDYGVKIVRDVNTEFYPWHQIKKVLHFEADDDAS